MKGYVVGIKGIWQEYNLSTVVHADSPSGALIQALQEPQIQKALKPHDGLHGTVHIRETNPEVK